MAGELDDGSVLVSATNGKTTTAAMIAAALERAGRPVVHNRAGSNMAWGVATALLDAGREPGQIGLFEVDEAWLPAVARDTAPAAAPAVEPVPRPARPLRRARAAGRPLGRAHRPSPDGRARFVLNADDPLVADLGRERAGVTYFGVEDDSQALPELQHAADSKHCRNCGHAYDYDAVYLGHMGRYRCPNCGRKRPEPQVAATRVDARRHGAARASSSARPRASSRSICPLPGLYNVYNAVAAAATALELGVPLAHGAARRSRASAARSGGWRRSRWAAASVSILLIKNPAGANEVLRTLTLEDGAARPLDRPERPASPTAATSPGSGTPTSRCSRGRVRRVTCSGTRAEEMALRLKYAGVERRARRWTATSAARSTPPWRTPPASTLYALPTYTALLELRDLLAERGLAKRWSE